MKRHIYVIAVFIAMTIIGNISAHADSFSKGKAIWEKARQNAQFSWSQNDFRQAIPLLEEGLEEGYGEAAYMLGVSYLEEYGVARDLEKARKYFEKGLELGFEKGNIEIGDLLIQNPATRKEGVAAWRKAYASGQYGATGRCAMAEYYGWVKDPAHDVAFQIASENLEEAANSRYNGWQIVMLGDFFADKKYPVKYTDRLGKAAALYYLSGISSAQLKGAKIMLDNNLEEVLPVLINTGGAKIGVMRMLRDAMNDTTDNVCAEAAYLYATHMTTISGNKSDYADFCKRNYGMGVEDAMTLSAELGWKPAMETLSLWYETGMYVPKNIVKAKQWRGKAGIPEVEVAADESDEIFDNPEEPAVFPGGTSAFTEWTGVNKRDGGTANGSVKVSFIVEKDGSVGSPEIIKRSATADHNREVLRLVTTMPKFIPAKNNGKAVRSKKTVTFSFELMQG